MNRFHRLLRTILAYIEKRTLQEHFRAVETELRRDSKTRAANLVREYRERGQFPVNLVYRHARVPFLRDHRGTSCAMAYLMERTGAGALVDRLVCTENNIYMEEVRNPGVLSWLQRTGLTREDAARIQPGYNFGDHGMHHVTAPVRDYVVPPLPAPEHAPETWLILVGAICAGMAAWFAIRWLRSRRAIKQPLILSEDSSRQIPGPLRCRKTYRRLDPLTERAGGRAS